MPSEEKIAKIHRTFLGIEDHGIFTAMLDVEYGGGSAQGLGGWAIDDVPAEKGQHRAPSTECGRWVAGVIRACGVRSWEEVKGRTVIAIFEGAGYQPIGIKPLPTEPGEPFYFNPEHEAA